MFTAKINEFYSKIENKYYNLMDACEKKGIPIYHLHNFLEKHGIPAFPFLITLIAIIIITLALLFAFPLSMQTTLNFTFTDEQGNDVQSVRVQIEHDADLLVDKTLSSGARETINLMLGTTVTLKVSKQGFEDGEYELKLKEKDQDVTIQLTKVFEAVQSTIELIDSETGERVRNADVTISWQNESNKTTTDEDGLIKLTGIPKGEIISIEVNAPGYEKANLTTVLLDGSTAQISLSPTTESKVGESTLVVRVKDKITNEFISDVIVKVYNKQSNELISELLTENGVASDNISKGTVVRITAEKEGFISYNSMTEDLGLTLRLDEEEWIVLMEHGGTDVTVNVSSLETGQPLSGTIIRLFDLQGNKLDENVTGFSGAVTFNDLNALETFTVSGEKTGFLVGSQVFSPRVLQTVNLKLKKITSSNSAVLTVNVTDNSGKPVSNASLFFFTEVNNAQVPLGIDNIKTDFTGFAQITDLEVGKTIKIKAVKNEIEGTGTITIEQGKLNSLEIVLTFAEQTVKVNLLDEAGLPLQNAFVTLTSDAGDILFMGDVSENFSFQALGNKTINIEITTDDTEYSEKVNIEGKTEITIQLKEATEITEAETQMIKFIGVENFNQETVLGLEKGKEAFLVFEVNFPDGYDKGAVHVRLGLDSDSFAESNDTVITGFEAVTDKYFYGRSYQPTPAPGNEAVDFSNYGSAGQENKFIELYWDQPVGVKKFKIKVKTKESVLDSVDLSYRAWVEKEASFVRSPADSELKEKEFTGMKTPLYAETFKQKLQVLEEETSCSQGVCWSFKFFDAYGNYWNEKDFEALVNETYALQTTIEPLQLITPTLKHSTNASNPLISFISSNYSKNSAELIFPIEDLYNSNIELQDLGTVNNGEKLIINTYFKTRETGHVVVNSQLQSNDIVLNESQYFDVLEDKELIVTVKPSNTITLGEDFVIKVESITGELITNANLKLTDEKGNLVFSTVGLNTKGNGLNGEYEINNTFNSGNFVLEVQVKTFKRKTIDIAIGKDNILEIDKGRIKLFIDKSKTMAQETLKLQNRSSKRVTDITAKVVYIQRPEDLTITAFTPASINGNGTGIIQVSAEYLGGESTAFGQAELIVTGRINGSELVVTKSSILVYYNHELDEDCLELIPETITTYLVGSSNSSKKVDLAFKNNCETRLDFIPRVIGNDTSNLDFSIPALSLEEGESKTIQLIITNTIKQNLDKEKVEEFTLLLESEILTKSIPVTVNLWNHNNALTLNPAENLLLRLVQPYPNQNVEGTLDFQITNTGQEIINNIQLSADNINYANVATDFTGTRTDFTPQQINDLKPGESQTITITFNGNVIRTRQLTQRIKVSGTINNTGEKIEKEITLTIIISSPGCIKVEPEFNPLEFRSQSREGSITKSLTVSNECGQTMTITGVLPERAEQNIFTLQPVTLPVLAPGQIGKYNLTLRKNSDADIPMQMVVIAIPTATENTPNIPTLSDPFNVRVLIGESARPTGKVSREISLPYCDKEGTANLVFPLVSETDCTAGYCDAESLGKFIAKKLKEEFREAKTVIQRVSSNTKGTSCETTGLQGYCDLGSLDQSLQPEILTVYLQNDNLSSEMLEDIINNRTEFNDIKMFSVKPHSNSENSDWLQSTVQGFVTHQLFYPPNLQGCGEYTITLRGVVKVSGTQITENVINYALTVEGEPLKTSECENKIQNVQNFLPADKGYNLQKSKNSWLAGVESNPDTRDIAEEMSKALFGGQNRITQNAATNKITVDREEFNGIVKLTLINETGKYKNVRASVNNSMEEKTRAIKAGEAISSLINQSANLQACIASDESYLIIQSTEPAAKDYSISGCTSLPVSLSENCCEFKVKSNVPDTISFNLMEKTLDGISEMKLKEKDSFKEISLDTDTFELTADTDKSFLFCATANEKTDLVLGKKATIIVESKQNIEGFISQRHTNHEISFQLCGITPTQALNEIQRKENGAFYTTLNWDNKYYSKNAISICEAESKLSHKDFQNKYLISSCTQQPMGVSYYAKSTVNKYKSALAFAGACAVSSAVCNGVLKVGIGMLPGVLMDCLPTTALALYQTAMDVPEEIRDNDPVAWVVTGAVDGFSVLWNGGLQGVGALTGAGRNAWNSTAGDSIGMISEDLGIIDYLTIEKPEMNPKNVALAAGGGLLAGKVAQSAKSTLSSMGKAVAGAGAGAAAATAATGGTPPPSPAVDIAKVSEDQVTALKNSAEKFNSKAFKLTSIQNPADIFAERAADGSWKLTGAGGAPSTLASNEQLTIINELKDMEHVKGQSGAIGNQRMVQLLQEEKNLVKQQASGLAGSMETLEKDAGISKKARKTAKAVSEASKRIGGELSHSTYDVLQGTPGIRSPNPGGLPGHIQAELSTMENSVKSSRFVKGVKTATTSTKVGFLSKLKSVPGSIAKKTASGIGAVAGAGKVLLKAGICAGLANAAGYGAWKYTYNTEQPENGIRVNADSLQNEGFVKHSTYKFDLRKIDSQYSLLITKVRNPDEIDNTKRIDNCVSSVMQKQTGENQTTPETTTAIGKQNLTINGVTKTLQEWIKIYYEKNKNDTGRKNAVEKYDAILRKVAEKHPNIDIELLKAIMAREAGYDSKTQSLNEKARGSSGEYGLMQVMPTHWCNTNFPTVSNYINKDGGCIPESDRFDVETNISLAADLIQDNLNLTKINVCPEDERYALLATAYNGGASKVEDCLVASNAAPITKEYVPNVMAWYEIFKEA
ncbi:MAG: transglycosylase SLT domain-containing protein [archaeon]